MPGRKKTWFAVLGLLNWRPMSGYDIKRFVEIGLSHFWSESYGALYPTLDQLVAARLVRRQPARRGAKRRRHVFSITGRGRAAVESWLREPAAPPGVRNEMLLKLFLGPHRPASEIAALLAQYRAQELERLESFVESERVLRRALREDEVPAELTDLLRHDRPGGRVPGGRSRQVLIFLLTLRHGILATQARVAWCHEALRSLSRRPRRSPGNAR